MRPQDQKRLQKLQRFYEQHNRLPSYAEMLELFALKSKNAIYKLVDRLIESGYLQKERTSKSKSVISPTSSFLGVPLLGRVGASFPSAAEEELADVVTLDDYLIENRSSSFLLRVTGDSMTGAGIQPNDLVIIERNRTPKNGDIVIAEVDHEWTMKYYQKRGKQISLVPANKKYTIIKPKQQLNIAGVVRGVIRKYD